MTKTALIIASDGAEEMELMITIDILRRAGVEVTIASLQDTASITCAHKTSVNVDKFFKDVLNDTFDAVVLPGGQPGSDNLAKDNRVGKILKHHDANKKIVAAICAAPLAFKSHNIAVGGTITCYPSVADQFKFDGYNVVNDNVVVYNNIVTSRGPGTAFDFGLKLAELLVGVETATSVRKALLL